MSRLRRAIWACGAPARALLIGAIRVYRATLSGWLGGQCRFYPSCSRYAQEAVRTRGALVGTVLSLWRVLRCNPFGEGGVDHVPPPRRDRGDGPAYDAVLRTGHPRPTDGATA